MGRMNKRGKQGRRRGGVRELGGRNRRERRPDLVSLRRGVSQSVKEGEHPSDRE
jgi:hypothetical protein